MASIRRILTQTKSFSGSSFFFPGILIAPSALWVIIDKAVWQWDPAWYGEVSASLFFLLRRQTAEWPNAMLSAFATKPPGIAWLGQFFVPLQHITGSVDDALMLMIILIQWVTLVLTYRTVRDLAPHSPAAPLAACVFVAAAPLFVGMSHKFFVEPLQTMAVAWIMLIAIRADQLNGWIIVGHVVAAAALAMMAKITSPLYVVAPAILVIYALFQKRYSSWSLSRRQRRLGLYPVLAIGVIMAVPTMLWYARNWGAVFGKSQSAAYGAGGEMWGHGRPLFDKLVYWLGAMHSSFAPSLFLLPVAVVVVVGAVRMCRGRDPQTSRHRVVAIMAATQLLFTLVVFTSSRNEEPRFLLPLIPYLALLIGMGVSALRWRGASVLIVVLLLMQYGIVYAQTFSLIPSNTSVSVWIQRYPAMPDEQEAVMLDSIVESTCSEETAWRYNIVGVELPWLNANTLSFHVAKRMLDTGYRCFYTSVGYRQDSVDRAWERIQTFKIAHFVTVDPDVYRIPENGHNVVSVPVLERVASSVDFERQDLNGDHPGILIFDRVPERQ